MARPAKQMSNAEHPLLSAHATWTVEAKTPEKSSKIRDLREAVQRTVVEKFPEGMFAAPCVPTELDRRYAFFVVTETDEGYRCHLSLTPADDYERAYERGGEDNSLDKLREAADIVGGPARFKALVQEWGPRGPVLHSVHFHLRKAAWKCLLIPSLSSLKEPMSAAQTLGDAHVDGVSYRYTSGASGLTDLEVAESADDYHIEASFRAVFELGDSHWLPMASQICKMIVDATFVGSADG